MPGRVYTRSVTRGRLAGALAAAVAAAVLGVLVSGRGDSPVAAAASKTANAGSAHVAFTLRLGGPTLAGGKTLTVRGHGAVDGTSADVTVDDTGAPANLPSSIHAILLRQDGHEIAFAHATPMPPLAAGKSWVEVDLSLLAGSHGVDLEKLAAGASGETPTQILDLLRGAGAAVRDLGSASVGGVSATHYRVLVDAAELAQVAGVPFGSAARHAREKVPVDVWIGTDGLVHRLALVLKHGASRAAFNATLSDYGASVSVSAPPSSDVLNLTGFLTGAGRMPPLG